MATALKLPKFTASLRPRAQSCAGGCRHGVDKVRWVNSTCEARCLGVSCGPDDIHRSEFCSGKLPSNSRFLKQCALPLDRASLDADEAGEGETGEPWLGAVVYKRSAVQSHYEYRTSLEDLGLVVLSSPASSAVAQSIGIRAKTVESEAKVVTPVGISLDVTKEGRNLRLDGILRTAISLCCNRCLAPVVERVFADFSLLLTDKPVKEPTQQRIGVVLGERSLDEGKEELDIDLDDKLHFPREAKEIDLSKYMRDTVHLEIASKSLCSSECRGLCFTCGTNLNRTTCNCTEEKVTPSWGPLEQLKQQLEEEKRRNDGSE